MTEPLPTALEIVRTHSLASLVAQEVERMILAGEVAAGERLNEQSLATRLGTSRGPVREAIRGLERLGLVVTVVNQGSYVRQVGEDEAIEIYEVRAVLTGHACAVLAEAATPAQLAELRGLERRMAAARRGGDAAGYYRLNREFHGALLRFAGNARAARICEELGNELNLFRRRSLVPDANMHASNAEHDAILRAIAAADPAQARAAGEVHIRGGKLRFTATCSSAADSPKRELRRTILRKNGQGGRSHGHLDADGPAGDGRRPGAARNGGVGPG